MFNRHHGISDDTAEREGYSKSNNKPDTIAGQTDTPNNAFLKEGEEDYTEPESSLSTHARWTDLSSTNSLRAHYGEEENDSSKSSARDTL